MGFLALGAVSFGDWVPTKIGFWGPNNYVSINGATSSGFGGYGVPDSANDFHALFWKSGDQAFTDIHPDGFCNSYIKQCIGGYQYGFGMALDGHNHALRWQGTAGSVIDLHPGGLWSDSRIFGAFGNDAVGNCSMIFDGLNHAAFWKGSTSNFIDLTPDNAQGATPFACGADSQAGVASWDGFNNHAAIWHGSAASIVDLNPSWSKSSYALHIAGEMQGGLTYVDGPFSTTANHATVWRGTAASAVDLNGPTNIESTLNDMNSDFQVGSVTVFNSPYQYNHATVWQGSAESAFDLQTSLSSIASGVYGSTAVAITESGDIIGYAGSSVDGNFLVKWTHVVPEPTSIFAVVLGIGFLVRRRTK